jgi:MFS family permease
VLSALADRLPRHRVLIGTDAARAVVVAVMVVPGIPLPVLLVLLFVVSLGAPPFESARSALTADVLTDDRYAVANSVTNLCLQLTAVIGFVVGGALVALTSARAALAFDAVTFALSAVWLAVRLRRRPAPTAEGGAGTSLWQDAVAGLRFIATTPRPRAIVAVLWAGSLFAYTADGLAAPFTAELGGGSTDVGVLLAAGPLGITVGGLAVTRLVAPARRERLIAPLLVATMVLLALAGALAQVLPAGNATFVVVVALLFLSGVTSCWFIPLQVVFTAAVPAALRGRAFGVAMSGVFAVQSVGALVAGALAEVVSPAAVVAVSGIAGLVAVTPVLLALLRTRPAVAAGTSPAGASVA